MEHFEYLSRIHPVRGDNCPPSELEEIPEKEFMKNKYL